jgi:hypothetical protein
MTKVVETSIIQRLNKGHYGGVLMALVGGVTLYQSFNYHIGTLRRMGPGFYPALLGSILIVLGAVLAIQSRAEIVDEKQSRPPEWRGWFCICASILAFMLLGKYGGLLPASFAVVFISALGDRENSLKSALLLSILMCAVSVAVFAWALKIQMPLFRWG